MPGRPWSSASSKTSNANTVDVVQAVQSKLAQLQSQSGAFELVTVQDYSSFIIESRDSLVREGLLGALFAIITIFIFLMSLRSTLVAAVSIPVSIMTALVLMLVAGVTINIMTLGGLAHSRRSSGGRRYRRPRRTSTVTAAGAIRCARRSSPGTREVASAITSSTLTTVGCVPADRLSSAAS